MLITPTKQTIFIYDFNFNEEALSISKNLMKITKLPQVFQNSEPNWH